MTPKKLGNNLSNIRYASFCLCCRNAWPNCLPKRVVVLFSGKFMFFSTYSTKEIVLPELAHCLVTPKQKQLRHSALLAAPALKDPAGQTSSNSAPRITRRAS